MGILDATRVRAALGSRLADRFLQYTSEPDEAERRALILRVDEHLAQIQRAAARRGDGQPDVARGGEMAAACKRLLLRCPVHGEACAAIVAAVRYFIDTHDLERDDEPHGFDDDEQVLSFVAEAVSHELH
jgi:hypothetical protein